VAYDGTRFAGSQVQPGVRTVHGEVARALHEIDPDAPLGLRWAGRTDAGVSARGNVVAFETTHPAESLCAALTFRMEDAWCWALAPVDAAFEPRHARLRLYRYFLRSGADAAAVEKALRPFVGTHDFTAFCRLEEGVNPTRTVREVAARRDGPFVVVDVAGESFLWNQVRRMVEAARREAAGEIAPGRIADALAAGKPADLGTATPEGLLLLDVRYDGLAWTPAPAKVTARMAAHFEPAELAVARGRAMREGA
jgi:tRNA pseudouridine38-40 synthase